MSADLIIDGIDLVYRRKIDSWIVVLGPDSVYHLSQPSGSHWQVRRPRALEALFVERSLVDCVQQIKRMEERRKRRVDLILSDPIVRKTLERHTIR